MEKKGCSVELFHYLHLSGSRDIISHVTIRILMGHFLSACDGLKLTEWDT